MQRVQHKAQTLREGLCSRRCKKAYTHNRCYSMCPCVTSWLPSAGLSSAYPFFLYTQRGLSLIDFIAPVNTLSVHGCDGDNSVIACLLCCRRMQSCWTNSEHAHTWTHMKKHWHSLRAELHQCWSEATFLWKMHLLSCCLVSAAQTGWTWFFCLLWKECCQCRESGYSSCAKFITIERNKQAVNHI